MKKIAFVVLGVLLASTAAAEEISQTLDAAKDGKVSVSNLAGSVEVIGWNRSQVEVTGELGDDVEELIFERDGKHTTIKVRVPERSWGHKDVSSDLVIKVPRGSSLDISTVSADIDVDGVRGEQDLQAVSGDISCKAVAEEVDAETVSGDVDIEGDGSVGEWDLSSVSGDVTAIGVAGEVKAEVVSGDIDISQGSFERVKLETVNGDITFDGGLRKNGKMDVETVNGGVDVDFTGSISAEFEIETFNGRIRNCFGPKAERVHEHAPGWELSFAEGGGDGRVSIATLNGGISLCKE